MRWRTKTTGRRGVAATEFAVVLPLLVTLVLGCVDFGRFAQTAIAVASAARAGAGFGINHRFTSGTWSNWQTQVEKAVADDLGQLRGFDRAKLTVVVSAPVETDGTWRAQVDVRYPFETLVSWPGLPASLSLQQVVSMPALNP